MTAAERAQEVFALARRWFLLLHRDRLQLVFSLAQPPLWFLFLGSAVGRAVDMRVIGTDDYAAFMLGSIVAVTAAAYAMSGAMPVLWDKETGYLDKLMAMPITRSSVIVSRFLFQFALGSAQVVLVILVGLIFGVRIASGPLGVLAMLAIAGLLSMSATAAFMALAYRVPTHGTFFAVAGFRHHPVRVREQRVRAARRDALGRGDAGLGQPDDLRGGCAPPAGPGGLERGRVPVARRADRLRAGLPGRRDLRVPAAHQPGRPLSVVRPRPREQSNIFTCEL